MTASATFVKMNWEYKKQNLEIKELVRNENRNFQGHIGNSKSASQQKEIENVVKCIPHINITDKLQKAWLMYSDTQ